MVLGVEHNMSILCLCCELDDIHSIAIVCLWYVRNLQGQSVYVCSGVDNVLAIESVCVICVCST